MDKLFARDPLLLPHLLEVVHGPLGAGGEIGADNLAFWGVLWGLRGDFDWA